MTNATLSAEQLKAEKLAELDLFPKKEAAKAFSKNKAKVLHGLIDIIASNLELWQVTDSGFATAFNLQEDTLAIKQEISHNHIQFANFLKSKKINISESKKGKKFIIEFKATDFLNKIVLSELISQHRITAKYQLDIYFKFVTNIVRCICNCNSDYSYFPLSQTRCDANTIICGTTATTAGLSDYLNSMGITFTIVNGLINLDVSNLNNLLKVTPKHGFKDLLKY